MLQDRLSGWMMRSMRWIGVSILVLGIASLVFGIILLVAANTVHNEEVEQLELDLAPTSIDGLKDKREEIRDARHAVIAPADVHDFVQSPPIPPCAPCDSTDYPRYLQSYAQYAQELGKWEAWHSVLVQEKGMAIAVSTMGWAQVDRYAGIGTIILSVGLILTGLVAIGLGPGMSRMRTAMAELTKPSEEAPVSPEEVPSED